MLTEQFINLSCTVLLSENEKFTDSVINDLTCILASHEDDDVALQFRKKFHLAKTIARLRRDKKPPTQVLDELLSAKHFDELSSFLKLLSKREIPDEKTEAAINQICQKKQLLRLQNDLPKLEDFISKFNSNSFTDTSEVIDNWNGIISNVHSNVLEEKRKEATANIKELDMWSDNYDNVLNQIEISYSGKNSISTGYDELDNYMNGGFEPTRLYIFGGCSGDGKSVLLNNFIKNAVERNKDLEGPASLYIYFTLENLIDESLVRLYCSIEDKDIQEMIKNYEHERTVIRERLIEWQRDHNSIVCLAYFAPTLTSVSDLVSYCDIMKSKYDGIAKLKATYTDYLDLLRAGQTFDLKRLEMGQVTIDMKVAAVMQGVPWTTVTQLNRAGYDPNEMPNLVNMSESIKKVEHSDFVGIIKNVPPEVSEYEDARTIKSDADFKIGIGKNRSGPKNKIINLKSNFSHFRIDDNSRNSTILMPNDDEFDGCIL